MCECVCECVCVHTCECVSVCVCVAVCVCVSLCARVCAWGSFAHAFHGARMHPACWFENCMILFVYSNIEYLKAWDLVLEPSESAGAPGVAWVLLEVLGSSKGPPRASWKLQELLGHPGVSWARKSLMGPTGVWWSLLGPCGLVRPPGGLLVAP